LENVCRSAAAACFLLYDFLTWALHKNSNMSNGFIRRNLSSDAFSDSAGWDDVRPYLGSAIVQACHILAGTFER
jgi:hypothetical protein